MDEEELTLQIAKLVEELTNTVITEQPANVYECCAQYLERKLEERNGKK